MNLEEFIKTYVCNNSLIRLWTIIEGGHKMLHNKECDNSVCMEWEILKGSVWQSLFRTHKVIGVKDIVVDDFYREAINIVIEE